MTKKLWTTDRKNLWAVFADEHARGPNTAGGFFTLLVAANSADEAIARAVEFGRRFPFPAKLDNAETFSLTAQDLRFPEGVLIDREVIDTMEVSLEGKKIVDDAAA